MAAENLILLPGMMCDARMWSMQVASINIPSQIPNLGKRDNFPDMADDILAEAPPQFAVAGLSMGGILAFELWRRAPHRITHMALLDTTPLADAKERQALRLEQIEKVAAGGLRALAIEELKPMYLASDVGDAHDALLETVLDMALDHGPTVFHRQSLALKNRADSRSILKSIDCPTTVICGSADRLCPVSIHELMADEIPDSNLVIIPECGHLSAMEKPDIVNEHLLKLFAKPPNAERIYASK